MLSYTQEIQRKLNPIKESRPWSLLKNPVSAELMHISMEFRRSLTNNIHFHGQPHYISVFLWIPGNVTLRGTFEAFHRFNRRYHVNKLILI